MLGLSACLRVTFPSNRLLPGKVIIMYCARAVGRWNVIVDVERCDNTASCGKPLAGTRYRQGNHFAEIGAELERKGCIEATSSAGGGNRSQPGRGIPCQLTQPGEPFSTER